ncbi:MAG: sensor histidine kinase [Gammaproteobacteria bacterium]
MKLNELMNTTAFALAVLYSTVFGVLTAGVFALIYWMNTDFILDRARAQLTQETLALVTIYESHGIEALAEAVRTRSTVAGLLSHHYLLENVSLGFVAGNLSEWPEEFDASNGLIEFQRPVPHPAIATIDWDEDAFYTVAARVTSLPNGHRLLVGFSLYEFSELREQSLAGLIIGSATTIVLALILGVVLGRTMLKRVDAIDTALADIMAGDLGRRITVTQRMDEFGQLAARINRVLDRLEHLVITLRELARNLSHDLRTPLYRLRDRLVQMQNAEGDSRSNRFVERGMQDVDTLVNALDDLLDVTRTSEGSQLSLFEEVDLTTLTREAAQDCARQARRHGVRVCCHLEDGLRVRGVTNLLSQALAHLLQHAMAGTRPSGTLDIRLERLEDQVNLSVRQSGPMSHDMAYGLESSASTPAEWVINVDNLALSVVGAVAKLHGARLLLANDNGTRYVQLRFAL